MLTIYCREETWEKRLVRSVPKGSRVRTIHDWYTFERSTSSAECSVVMIPWLATDPDADCLATFKQHHPQHPVVLVTRGDIVNARSLTRLAVEDVVWMQEVESELSAAVGRTCILSHSRTLAESIDQARHLPPRLRKALALACRAERPFRTVGGLAAAAGCDRRTLWHHWKSATGDRLRLQDFLHWLLLVRAAGGKTRGKAWSEVAGEVGVHPHSLGRLSKQLAGLTLREVEAGGQGAIADRFHEQVLEQIFPEDSRDKLVPIGQIAVEEGGAKG